MAALPKKSERPLVVHVSADFPDPIKPFKTPVIKKLIELTDFSFDHRVISINRTSPGAALTFRTILLPGELKFEESEFERGVTLSYSAPSKGLRHRTKLLQLGDRIAEACLELNRKPNLLVAHKLTVEGIAVRRAAQRLMLPYAVSVQGNTDTKILATRPDLRSELKRIYHEAEVVFPFTPWAQTFVDGVLGERKGPSHLLPCPTDLDEVQPPRLGGDGFISVFHLKNWREKNLQGLVKAWKLLARNGRAPRLEVIGGGTKADFSKCIEIARDTPEIHFTGPMNRTQLAERMASATALVLPSLRESFGLVFIEALFAGTPIIYPSGAAIDGYFDGSPFALRIDARSSCEIAAAVVRAQMNASTMRAALAEWQLSPASVKFTREHIAATFERGLIESVSPP